MSIGAKIGAAVRALMMLLGLWVILGAIGWGAGALPALPGVDATPDPDVEPIAQADAGEADARDAGEDAESVARHDPQTDDPPENPDTVDPDTVDPDAVDPDVDPATAATADPTEPDGVEDGYGRLNRAEVLARARVCEDSEHASLGVGSVVGDERVEWIVVCERTAHVLGHDAAGGTILRLARIRRAGESASLPAKPTVGDVDGDGRGDLVLGFVDVDDQGGPNGGSLVLIPGTASGAFGEPSRLAEIAAVSVGLAELNSRDGMEVAAINWADGFGRRPSELWLIGGGASPARIGRTRLRDDGASLGFAHLDGDDHLDVITIDAEGARWFAGSASARLGDATELELAGGRRIVSGDLDGDGRIEGLLVGEGLFLLEDGEPKPIDAPHGVREVLIADANADARPDLILLTRQRVAALLRRDEGYEETLLVNLPGTFRPLDLALSELAGGSRAILILGRTRLGIELLVVPLGATVSIDPLAEVAPAEDAPLVLDVTLP